MNRSLRSFGVVVRRSLSGVDDVLAPSWTGSGNDWCCGGAWHVWLRSRLWLPGVGPVLVTCLWDWGGVGMLLGWCWTCVRVMLDQHTGVDALL